MTFVEDTRLQVVESLDLLPVVLFAFDSESICTLSVGGALPKLGLEPNEFVGRRLLDVYADNPEVVHAIRQTLAGQSGAAAAIAHGVMWETHFRPLADSAGNVIGGVGLTQDISDRPTVDAQLKESDLDAQQLLRAIPDQLVWLDAEGRVLASKAARDGHDDQRVSHAALGSIVADVLDERLVAELYAHMAAALESNETSTFDYRIANDEGDQYFEARVVPGRRHTVLLILRDVTARQQLETELLARETELQHAQRLEAIGRLAGGIAHEINTPIQFIGDNVRFLQESFATTVTLVDAYRECLFGEADMSRAERVAKAEAAERDADVSFLTEEVPQAAHETLDGVERVASIVKAMKAVGRPSQVEQSPADLNAAIESTVVVSRSEYKQVADVVLELGDLPPVICHIGELNQVFINLIVNAAHAIGDKVAGTAQRGRIGIRTWADDDHVVVEIGDDGGGIPDEIRHRIFEPFFTTKEVGKGTGQGLSLSRSLVIDRHGGSISVDSRPGEGTTFAIRLPVDGLPRAARSQSTAH
jgi:signal transduction histidine kinase